MNATRTLIAAIVMTAAAAGSALAQEATPWSAQVSPAGDRAAVAAQARQAVQQGSLHELYAINPAPAARSALSREAVRAETRAALASGEIARLNARTYETAPAAAQAAAQPVRVVSQLSR